MESMQRNKKTILLFIAPAFIIFSVIVIVPVIYSVYYSFFKWNLVGSKTFIGITNFTRLIQQDDIFKEATKNTFLLMGLSLLIEIPFAILIALAISGKIKGKRYFKTVIFMPNILSSVAIGLMWTFIYNPDFGIINRFLNFIGLENMAKLWLSEEKTVLPSIIVVIVWQFIGYHMILFLAAIENIPSSLNEAAEIDGTNSWQKLRYITLCNLNKFSYCYWNH
jgi:raffinose/stachyose/melibiose transport system permease protein